MVKQIEIETTVAAETDKTEIVPGDVPSLFGTLTTQRYHWDDIICIIATVERIENYKDLSQSKRRELVNKYPLFVAWYCAVRLELILKTVVVPLYGASSYVAVFEWSPTGGMAHLHYILWKRGAPRFDLHAQDLQDKAAALRKAGLVAGGEVTCDIKYVVDFFADYITEWNPNRTAQGEEKTSHVAEKVNETLPHTASLSTQEMLDMLRSETPHARYEYYERAVRTEHLHDFHHPDPTGPPNPAQPCARLLKGTLNMWYCGNGYPRELVGEPCDRSVAQDALRPELWRVNLCRNCQVMNPHIPLVSFANQSNSDATPVVTRHQAEEYCCKYCSKYTKGKGQKCALYEVIDDMERKDAMARERFGASYEESKLGGKLHRAFMAEIGVEMCQAEVAHHANRLPEYLISRDVKYVHLYKKALAINRQTREKVEEEEWPWGDEEEAQETLATRPSDVDLYEKRTHYVFWPRETPPSPHLPPQATPEEQVSRASLWEFFRLVRFKGGQWPYLEWHDEAAWPIVVMSPVVKLTEGPDFAFGARWALMQHHAWTDRSFFLDMPDEQVQDEFRRWRTKDDCPWHIKQQYLQENGRRARAGAGPAGKRSSAGPNSDPMEPAEYEAKIAALVEAKDYAGAAALQYQHRLALESVEAPGENDDADVVGVSGEEERPDGSETEHSSSADEEARAGNEQCSWVGEHAFVSVVWFGVRILNVFGVCGVRCSGMVLFCSVVGMVVYVLFGGWDGGFCSLVRGLCFVLIGGWDGGLSGVRTGWNVCSRSGHSVRCQPWKKPTPGPMQTRTCSRCCTKATWRKSHEKNSNLGRLAFSTGNTIATATPVAPAWPRKSRAPCRRASSTSTKTPTTMRHILEIKKRSLRRSRSSEWHNIGSTKRDGTLPARHASLPRALAR